MSISNMKIGQLRTLVCGLLAAGATRDEITDIVASATSEVGEWQQLGDIARARRRIMQRRHPRPQHQERRREGGDR
jgi:hypothetical protein